MGAAEKIRTEHRRKAAGAIVQACVDALTSAVTRSGLRYVYEPANVNREQVRALVEEVGQLLVLLDEAYADLAEGEPVLEESGETRIEDATHAALGAALNDNLKAGGLL